MRDTGARCLPEESHGRVGGDAYRSGLYLNSAKLDIDLTLTENPLGYSPNILPLDMSDISSYAGTHYFKLLTDLEGQFSVSPGSVVLGAGIDGLLSEIVYRHLSQGDVVCTPHLTFPKIAYYAAGSNARIAYSDMAADLSVDLDSLLSAVRRNKAKACYICNPNNPTGLAISSSDIVEFSKLCGCLVIIDEANGEFMLESAINGTPDVENLMVLRTFSKIYGLAGARVGYAIGQPSLVLRLFAARSRYAIGEPSAALAAIALADCRHVNLSRSLIIEESKFLQRSLAARGFGTFGALTNCFVASIPCKMGDHDGFYQRLKAAGVGVVHGEAFNLSSSYFRVAPQTRETNEAFLRVIDSIKGELAV